MTPISSMRLLVVSAAPPDSSFSTPFHSRMAPQPPGPGVAGARAVGIDRNCFHRIILLFHRDHGETVSVHGEFHVAPGEGQAVYPLGVLLIPGPGIPGQHP